MDKKEKLEALKNFLREKNVSYKEDKVATNGMKIDLFVRNYGIAVHLSDDTDQTFFKSTKKLYNPFFIRDEETIEFILEKMQNCMARITNERTEREDRAKKHEAENIEKIEIAEMKPKRKRVRIQAERVSPLRR